MDVSIAIGFCDDPKYTFLRALIEFCMIFQNGKTGLNISIVTADWEYAPSFLLRSKCYEAEGKYDQAMMDIEKYAQFCPEQVIVVAKNRAILYFKKKDYLKCL